MLIKNENIEKFLNNEQSTSYILKLNSKGDIEVVNRYSFSTYLGRLFAFVTRKDTYKLKKIVEAFSHFTFENQQLQQNIATKLNSRISHYNQNHRDKEQLVGILLSESEELTNPEEDSLKSQKEVKLIDTHFNLNNSIKKREFIYTVRVLSVENPVKYISIPKEMTLKQFLIYVAAEFHININNFRIGCYGRLIGGNIDDDDKPISVFNIKDKRVQLVLKLDENLINYLNPLLQQFYTANPDYFTKGFPIYKDMETLDTTLLSLISRISRGKLDHHPLEQLTNLQQFLTNFKNKIKKQEAAISQQAIFYLDSFQSTIQSAINLYKQLKEKVDLNGPSDEVLEEALMEHPKIDVTPQTKNTVNFQVEEKIYKFDRENLLKTIGYLRGKDTVTKNQETFKIPETEEVDPAALTYVIQFMLEEDKLSFTPLQDQDLLNLYTHIQYLNIPRLEALCAKEIVRRIMKNPEQGIDQEFYDIYINSPGTWLGKMLKNTEFVPK